MFKGAGRPARKAPGEVLRYCNLAHGFSCQKSKGWVPARAAGFIRPGNKQQETSPSCAERDAWVTINHLASRHAISCFLVVKKNIVQEKIVLDSGHQNKPSVELFGQRVAQGQETENMLKPQTSSGLRHYGMGVLIQVESALRPSANSLL